MAAPSRAEEQRANLTAHSAGTWPSRGALASLSAMMQSRKRALQESSEDEEGSGRAPRCVRARSNSPPLQVQVPGQGTQAEGSEDGEDGEGSGGEAGSAMWHALSARGEDSEADDTDCDARMHAAPASSPAPCGSDARTHAEPGSSPAPCSGDAAQGDAPDDDDDDDDGSQDFGITLEPPDAQMHEPPLSTKEFMDSQNIGQHHITQCFMGVDAQNARARCDVRDQKKNTFMFVDRLDEKGSTPAMIQQVLYCLHMVNKYYHALRHGSDKIDKPFDVLQARPNDAYTLVNYGSCYHKHLTDSAIVTTPILSLTMHIEQASTGGSSPLVVFYMLLQVDCPITFNLVDCINRSCTKSTQSLKDSLICQDLQRMWIEIVHHQATFGGKMGSDMMANVGIDFPALFDADSNKCLWKLCCPPMCVQSMCRHMHMVPAEYVRARSKFNYSKASAMVRVRFPHIDAVIADNVDGHVFDAAWSDLCRKSCVAWENEHLQYKMEVLGAKKQERRRKAREQQDDHQDNPDGLPGGAGGGAAADVPPFDPPVIFATPTYINWENEAVADFVMAFTADPAGNKVSEFERICEEHPGDIVMEEFPRTMLTVVVEMTLLLPLESPYVSLGEWKMLNKDCLLPNNITLPILMVQHQRELVNRPSLSMFVGDTHGLSKDVLTMADMRQMLLSTSMPTNSMMYFRAHSIYELQLQSMLQHETPTQRVYAFSMYLLATAYPLAMTNANSDTGQYGGMDPRVSVFIKLGECAFAQPTRARSRCSQSLPPP